MRFKLCISILTILIGLTALTNVSSAASVPWSSEQYTAFAWAGCCWGDEDSIVITQYGPPLPVTANAYYNSLVNSSSTITSTTMQAKQLAVGANHSRAEASFTGTYTADDPLFVFSYDFTNVDFYHRFEINVQDLTASSTLYSLNASSDSSNILYISTPTDHEIQVAFSLYSAGDSCCDSFLHPEYASGDLTYNMAVAPEPISSILFITGGTLLAGRRFLRRKA